MTPMRNLSSSSSGSSSGNDNSNNRGRSSSPRSRARLRVTIRATMRGTSSSSESSTTRDAKEEDGENAEPLAEKNTDTTISKDDINKTPPSGLVLNDPASTPRLFPSYPSNVKRQWEALRNHLISGKLGLKQAKDIASAMDDIMKLVGLEAFKRFTLDMVAKMSIYKKQNKNIDRDRWNLVFRGNPGVGKTTAAKLYARLLVALKLVTDPDIHITSGAKLAIEGAQNTTRLINNYGTIFIDEAYQLTASYSAGAGRPILDLLLTAMEENVGKKVFIFAGYKKEMESFFEHNPGLSSRIPHTITFHDFTDHELLSIMKKEIRDQYGESMFVEGGMDGLYMRATIRQISRLRGSKGFGNARAVQNRLSIISARQTRRLSEIEFDPDRSEEETPETFVHYITKEDLLGPRPSDIISLSPAWQSLNAMIGLGEVKKTTKGLIQSLTTNYDRDLREEHPLQFSLNRVFYGPPGVGKTTVAKLYGQILADIGFLTNGEVVVKNPSDFIGDALGQSESRTKAILAATVGKVLIIDEAYMLCAKATGEESQDLYRRGVIDTIVAEVQGVPGEDRCIILLGYEEQLQTLFNTMNPGLARRFGVDDAFRFTPYSIDELLQILELKMDEMDLTTSRKGRAVAREVLSRNLRRPNFANAGAVENLLQTAKTNYQRRVDTQKHAAASGYRQSDRAEGYTEENPVINGRDDTEGAVDLLPEDFDPDCDRYLDSSSAKRFLGELKGTVGAPFLDKMAELLDFAHNLRVHGKEDELDKYIPMRFIFKGPSGTGKSTAARAMGTFFYNLGLLASEEVIECSYSDLVGQCVGHTGPKTRAKVESALGKVLLIDEAHRLAEGQYAGEAVDELVYLLNRDSSRHETRSVVILAGLDGKMELLLEKRPVLSGHFPEDIVFNNLTEAECFSLLGKELDAHNVFLPVEDVLDVSKRSELLKLFRILRVLPIWSNARDIKKLAVAATRFALKRLFSSLNAISSLEAAQSTSASNHETTPAPGRTAAPAMLLVLTVAELTTFARKMADEYIQKSRTAQKAAQKAASPTNPTAPTNPDKHAPDQPIATAEAPTFEEFTSEHEYTPRALKRQSTALSTQSAVFAKETSSSAVPHQAVRRRESIAIQTAEAGPSATMNLSLKIKEETDEEMERKIQERIQQRGNCPQGYPWVREGTLYRCTGGSHTIELSELQI